MTTGSEAGGARVHVGGMQVTRPHNRLSTHVIHPTTLRGSSVSFSFEKEGHLNRNHTHHVIYSLIYNSASGLEADITTEQF